MQEFAPSRLKKNGFWGSMLQSLTGTRAKGIVFQTIKDPLLRGSFFIWIPRACIPIGSIVVPFWDDLLGF